MVAVEIQQLVHQLKADRLVIQRQLGQGGFGSVYQGESGYAGQKMSSSHHLLLSPWQEQPCHKSDQKLIPMLPIANA